MIKYKPGVIITMAKNLLAGDNCNSCGHVLPTQYVYPPRRIRMCSLTPKAIVRIPIENICKYWEKQL